MEKVKKVLDRIFIEGLSAMAHGLFATLIIGTIIQQIGRFMGGNIGEMIFIAGKLAASLMRILTFPFCLRGSMPWVIAFSTMGCSIRKMTGRCIGVV